MIEDVDEALDHLNEIIRILEEHGLKELDDDRCYEELFRYVALTRSDELL